METQQIGSRLTEYVQLFQEAKRLVNDENAAVAILEQIGKDARCSMINERQNGNSNGFSNEKRYTIKDPGAPATTSQKWLLRKEGIAFSKDITKGEASELIDANQ